MTDDASFLAAIIDRPDDDLPRLVYADYLDESGDPARAEFIRVQCELARLDGYTSERQVLLVREAELLSLHRSRWLIPGLRGSQHFRRGFVEAVDLATDWLVAAGPTAFDHAPVREIRLGVLTGLGQLEALKQIPGLHRVETLGLANNDRRPVLALLRDQEWPRLSRLIIRNTRLFADELGQIISLPIMSQLRSLDVSGNPFSDAGLGLLARQTELNQLQELVVRCDEQPFDYSIHNEGVIDFARHSQLTSLERLNLSGHAIDDYGMRELLHSPSAVTWKHLDLSYNEIGANDVGFQALLESPSLGRLTTLSLAGLTLSTSQVTILIEWVRASTDRRVELGSSAISPEDRFRLMMPDLRNRVDLDEDG